MRFEKQNALYWCTRIIHTEEKNQQKFDARYHKTVFLTLLQSKKMNTLKISETAPNRMTERQIRELIIVHNSFWSTTFIWCQLSNIQFIEMFFFYFVLCCGSFWICVANCTVCVRVYLCSVIVINGQPPIESIKLYGMAQINNIKKS